MCQIGNFRLNGQAQAHGIKNRPKTAELRESGYLTKLLSNAAVKSFVERQEPEILEHFELVVNTVSMEEAVQQQQTDGVVSEPKAA